VTARVRGDAVHRLELTRIPAAGADGGDLRHRRAVDDADAGVLAVRDIQVCLGRVRREGDLPDRAVAESGRREERLADERPVRIEDLDAVVLTIADIDQAVVRRLRAVNRVPELLLRVSVRRPAGASLTDVRPFVVVDRAV